MKILQVGKFYPPSPGGMETLIRNLSEGLVAAGDSVTVLCSGNSPRRVEETIGGVRVLRSPYFGKLLSQPLTPTLPAELLRQARGFDVVNVHTPNPLAEAASLALPSSVPLVLSYHSEIVRQRALLPLIAPVLKKVLKRSDRIVVATPRHVSESAFLTGVAEKCEVIPYGLVSLPESPQDPATLRRMSALQARHGKFVLFVGRLVGYKGVSVLLRAMKSVDAKTVIVGDGPLRSELEAEARSLGIQDRVAFEGYVDDAAIEAYFRACELLVLPSVSVNEAFGIVQVEAMACSKPTVSTLLDSGITEVAENGVTGLQVPPYDPEALAGAIQALLRDGSRLRQMGAAARRRFEERFTREKMVASYRELYARVLRSRE